MTRAVQQKHQHILNATTTGLHLSLSIYLSLTRTHTHTHTHTHTEVSLVLCYGQSSNISCLSSSSLNHLNFPFEFNWERHVWSFCMWVGVESWSDGRERWRHKGKPAASDVHLYGYYYSLGVRPWDRWPRHTHSAQACGRAFIKEEGESHRLSTNQKSQTSPPLWSK